MVARILKSNKSACASRRFASDIRRGLGRRFGQVSSSRSTDQNNDVLSQMSRRTLLARLEDLRREAAGFIGQVNSETRRTSRSRTQAQREQARLAALTRQRERTRQRRERRGTTYRIRDWGDAAFGPCPEHFLLTIFKRHAGEHIRVVAYSGSPPEILARLSCGPPYHHQHPQGHQCSLQ